jgi:hypothetical protein
MCEEIKNRLTSVNAFHHFVQKILTSSLLLKNIIIIYIAIILLVVLYGCNISSLTMKDEYGLSMFGNKMQKDKVKGGWRRLLKEELHDSVLIKYYLGDHIKNNEAYD